VGKHGVNVAKFTDAYRSFAVTNSVGQSEQTAVGYRVAAIPTIAVGGRYTVTGDHAKMLAASDELIAKARAEDKTPRK
jgi:protein dithiol oxidoreductase (disulfide-forming)